MEKVSKFLLISLTTVSLVALNSCQYQGGGLGNLKIRTIKGFDYDPNTATLTIIPGEISMGDLEPDNLADQLYEEALAYEKKGKADRAYKKFKEIAKNYPTSTQAPNAFFRMAQYDELGGKWERAFDYYQALITTYMGTPLYAKALEGQKNIAYASATGEYRKKLLVFKKRVPRAAADKMLSKLIANAPQSEYAPEAQFLRGQINENAKYYDAAMDHYRTVTRDYPDSGFAGEALYRIGSILKQQTAKQGNRNIDNSRRSIETFDELIALYPKHPRAKDAREARGKIAGYDITRSFEVAQFYEKKKQYTSARFYYNDIITRTKSDSEIHKLAKARLAALPQ